MPQVEEIAIVLLASLAIAINAFGLISVLRNYRRLRQRMYLFVISLTLVNVIVGIAFMVDVIIKLSGSRVSTSVDQSACSEEGLIVMESLKAASVILSSLNTLTLTYALHKRTTRMGRHRSGTSSGSSAHTDGAGMPHIPAFDTMLRVLSLGSSQQNDGEEKTKLKKCKNEKSSCCESSFTETSGLQEPKPPEFASTKEEEYFRIHTNGFYRGQNAKAEKAQTKSQLNYVNNGKRMGKIAQMLAPKRNSLVRRGSNVKRASQSYIGRHSISVISVRTTAGLLSVIWLIFIMMWIIPIVARLHAVGGNDGSSAVDYFVCPVKCGQDSFPSADYISSNRPEQEDITIKLVNDNNEQVNEESQQIHARVRHNRTNIKEDEIPSGSFLVDEVDGFLNNKPQRNISDLEEFHDDFSTRSSITKRFSPCSGCSKLFYPISEVHVMVNAIIILMTWLYMSFSSLRLLWLRKHSNNVFVRYSALWRFLLFTSLFYLIVYTPYMFLCVYDMIKKSNYETSDLVASPVYAKNESLSDIRTTLSYLNDVTAQTSPTFRLSNVKVALQKHCFLTSSEFLYVTISSSLILFHSAVAPLCYLMRLLGCRKLLTGF